MWCVLVGYLVGDVLVGCLFAWCCWYDAVDVIPVLCCTWYVFFCVMLSMCGICWCVIYVDVIFVYVIFVYVVPGIYLFVILSMCGICWCGICWCDVCLCCNWYILFCDIIDVVFFDVVFVDVSICWCDICWYFLLWYLLMWYLVWLIWCHPYGMLGLYCRCGIVDVILLSLWCVLDTMSLMRCGVVSTMWCCCWCDKIYFMMWWGYERPVLAWCKYNNYTTDDVEGQALGKGSWDGRHTCTDGKSHRKESWIILSEQSFPTNWEHAPW